MLENAGPLLTTAGNLGGMALMGIAMLLLYREQLKAFREELSEERKLDRERSEAYLERMDEHRDHLLSEFKEMHRRFDLMHAPNSHNNPNQRRGG